MGKAVVAYYGSWAVYRKGLMRCDVDDLPAHLCTHLIYAFAVLGDDCTIKCKDPWQDIQNNSGGYKRMVDLKKKNPSLKVLIAVGGWNERSERFSKMAASPANRSTFINSVLKFLSAHKFDGLDLDWEYPGYAPQGGKPEDKNNFSRLVQELKQAFGSQYILSAAIACGVDKLNAGYDLPNLSRNLDMINVMTYDYHGAWDSTLGANAPLTGVYSSDPLCISATINHLLKNGVHPSKVILGVPFYGRTFKLANPSTGRLECGKTATQGGFPGPLIGEQNSIGYNEIRHELKNNSRQWVKKYDEQTQTPFLRNGDKVISYDDSVSIAKKVKFAKGHHLGGVMVWSIDTDDVTGIIKGKHQNFNLLRTINQELGRR